MCMIEKRTRTVQAYNFKRRVSKPSELKFNSYEYSRDDWLVELTFSKRADR